MTPRVDPWSLADIPDQAGRTILVTGTTVGGLGHHTALELARRGADVERQVLSRAVLWHCQDRIIRHDRQTIVF